MNLKKHKFKFQWCAFILLIAMFIFVAVYFENKTWISNALQTIGTITGIYLTIIVFLQSKEGADKHVREQIDKLQELNTKQINAIDSSTKEQIQILQETNEKKIQTIKEETDRQIASWQEITEKQIETLNRTTNEQITSFENEIREVTDELFKNSILLAEILGRELEKSLNLYNNALEKEETELRNLSRWKFLRTESEKEIQIRHQKQKVSNVKQGYSYFKSKYDDVMSFLGNGLKRLNSKNRPR